MKDLLKINPPLITQSLIYFLKQECILQRKINKAVVGLSGGIDSAVTLALCEKAFGLENIFAFFMPYKISSSISLDHAQLVADHYKLPLTIIPITLMVEGYLSQESTMTPHRLGNICSRCRTLILFDQSQKLQALPIGTGNKSEKLTGYYTWHGDDAPPINPLGDLYKTQIWELAKYLEIPKEVIEKQPSADLIPDQTDEGDLGISYQELDIILELTLKGYSKEYLIKQGLGGEKIEKAYQRISSTHWKRHLPTTASLTNTTIKEWYLRPVDLTTCP